MPIKAAELYASIDGDPKGLLTALATGDRALAASEKKADASTKRITAKQNAARKRLGQAAATGATVFGAAVVGGFAYAMKTSVDFDKQMSAVQARADASREDLAKLRAEAIRLGADPNLVVTASEAANGMEVLAAAGLDVQQILAAMPGTLQASAASGQDFASTADMMVSAMTQFKMTASDIPAIADVYAKAANISTASMTDIGMSMKYVGPVASALGLSLEETGAAIVTLANAGIKGDQAGTSLRMGISRLAAITPKATKALGKHGEAIAKSLEQAPTLAKKLELLRKVTKNMSKDEKVGFLKKLVGTEAMPAFLVLLDKGPKGLADLTKELQNADGASAKASKTMTDNLWGALQGLQGAVESAGINIGSGYTQPIRDFTESLSGFIGVLNSYPPEKQKALADTVLTLGGFALAGVGVSKVAGGIKTIIDAGASIKVVADNVGTILRRVRDIRGESVGSFGQLDRSGKLAALGGLAAALTAGLMIGDAINQIPAVKNVQVQIGVYLDDHLPAWAKKLLGIGNGKATAQLTPRIGKVPILGPVIPNHKQSTTPVDPRIHRAAGGVSDGPMSGYDAVLHGREWVIPTNNPARAASLLPQAAADAGVGMGSTFTGPIYVNVPDGKVTTFLSELQRATQSGNIKTRMAVSL